MSQAVTVRDNDGSTLPRRSSARVVAPPVDVFESADEILVIADVAGIPGEAIDVRVENGTLTVQAPPPAAEQPSPAFAREFDYPGVSRTFRIPAGIDTANIRADAKNGTLVVRLPKLAAAKPRKVAVRSSD
jgi:HSP20 family protein